MSNEDRELARHRISAGLGMHAIHHTHVDSSRAAFAELGLTGGA